MKLKVMLAVMTIAFSCLTSSVMAREGLNIISSSASNAKDSVSPTDIKPITVAKAEFGIFRVDESGSLTFIPTNKVPLQEGTSYGWQIQLDGYEGSVTWKEVFKLPKPAETWVNSENVTISEDRTEAVTVRTVQTEDGIIANSWSVAAGDPVGNHKIEIYIDNRRVASFNFEVVSSNTGSKS
jgi:hypothetical protein